MNKLLSTKCLYSGRVVNLCLDEIECDGKKCMREVVRHRGGVTVLAEKGGNNGWTDKTAKGDSLGRKGHAEGNGSAGDRPPDR